MKWENLERFFFLPDAKAPNVETAQPSADHYKWMCESQIKLKHEKHGKQVWEETQQTPHRKGSTPDLRIKPGTFLL